MNVGAAGEGVEQSTDAGHDTLARARLVELARESIDVDAGKTGERG